MQSRIQLRSSMTQSVGHQVKEMKPAQSSAPAAKKPSDNRFLSIFMSALSVWAV